MSLFNTENDPSTVTFDALVGEGKKYKDSDAAAKALAEKDRFIEQLKQENQEARRAAELAMTSRTPTTDRTQEIIDRIEALSRPATESQVTTPTERVEYNGLTEDQVLQVLEKREALARAKANMNLVKADLTEKYGDQYQAVLNSLQLKMGVDQKFLDNLAAQSPQAFNALLGQAPTQKGFTPPVSHTSSEGFKPHNSGPKARSHYLALKAQNKAEYDKPAIQTAMYKDAMALGEAFFDTND